jgi:hypothetical protein
MYICTPSLKKLRSAQALFSFEELGCMLDISASAFEGK